MKIKIAIDKLDIEGDENGLHIVNTPKVDIEVEDDKQDESTTNDEDSQEAR